MDYFFNLYSFFHDTKLIMRIILLRKDEIFELFFFFFGMKFRDCR